MTNNKNRFERFTNSSPRLCRGYLTPYISKIINRVQMCVTPTTNINQAYYTWDNVISDCLDGLLAGKELNKIFSEILIKVITVPLEDKEFDILHPDTWDKATDNDFFWKGEPVTNNNTDKPITEYQMALHFQKIFGSLEKDRSSSLTMREKRDYIIHFFEQAIKENQRKDTHKEFDIFDFDSWIFATNKPYYWKDSMLFSPEKKIITEKDLGTVRK